MRIAVFGVGAVGGYFGGRLTQTEHEVCFVARGEHLKRIQKHGLRVDSENGDFVALPTLVTDNPAEIGVVDVVVLATKAWQVESAAQAMLPLIGEDTVVVPLLNGVEAPMILANAIGEKHVLGGFCRVLSRVEAPGHIIQGGTPPFVAFGEMNGQQSERVAQLKTVFDKAQVAVQLPDNVQAAMWQKLLFISAFGGVGAATRMPVGVIRSIPETRQMLAAAMQETCTVAMGYDVPMAKNAVEIGLGLVDKLPHEATASMQRDLMNGYPSELDAQNGAVVRLGKKIGVKTPTHTFLYHILLPTEQKARNLL